MYVGLEVFVGCAVEITRGVTNLLLIAINRDAESLEVYKHFLAGCVVVIDAALVHEHRDAAGLVLDVNALENVARAVVAGNACLEEEAVFDSDGLV